MSGAILMIQPGFITCKWPRLIGEDLRQMYSSQVAAALVHILRTMNTSIITSGIQTYVQVGGAILMIQPGLINCEWLRST